MTELTYEQWLSEVNLHVQDQTGGFGLDDLIDYDTRSAYDEGLDPLEAAEAVIENDGTFA